MFGFSRRKRQQRERDIYHYWDGVAERAIDPLLAWNQLWRHQACQFAEELTAAVQMQKQADEANKIIDAKLAAAVKDDIKVEPTQQTEHVNLMRMAEDHMDNVLSVLRDVFRVPQFSVEGQPGLTRNEQQELLGDFFQYMNDLKKRQERRRKK